MSKRVLFFPQNVRREYFLSLLRNIKEETGWRIGVIAPEAARKAYAGIVSDKDIFFEGDLTRSMEWEREPIQEKRINGIIEDCEDLTGISANRILLSGERDMGRAYSTEFYYWPATRLNRMSLSSNEYPARVLRRLFWFVDNVFERFRPDGILFGLTASPLHFTGSLLAERAAIPCVVNRQSKIHSKRIYWTPDRSMFNTLARKSYDAKAAVNAPVSEMAVNFVRKFHEEPRTVHYIAENWKKAGGSKWLGRHKNFALLALARANHFVRRRKSVPPRSVTPKVFEFYQERYLKFRQKDLFQTCRPDELASMKYIYCPLHKEPELAVNFQAPYCHDQKNFIAYLSKTLPHGCKLLVREHRFNMGRRPTAYYKTLRRFPGVELIHPFDPQFKYIQNANLIVTDNGSTGWEGIVFKRPVITLAPTFYDAPGLTTYVSALKNLNDAVIRLLGSPVDLDPDEYDRRLGWMIDSEWETTLPEDPALVGDNLLVIATLLWKGVSRQFPIEAASGKAG